MFNDLKISVGEQNKMLSDKEIRGEMLNTVTRLCQHGRGILAADESTGTIAKRFQSIGLESTPELRRKYRKMLFTAPKLDDHISGVITYEETFFDGLTSEEAKPSNPRLIDSLTSRGILVGVKADVGLSPAPWSPDGEERVTKGLDTLSSRCQRYREGGATFTKWRCVYTIDTTKSFPSKQSVKSNAIILAQYAKISQQHGLVPIVEPEVLMDGDHSIEVSTEVTRKVLSETIRQLGKYQVDLSLVILKPNIVRSGDLLGDNNLVRVAELTLDVLGQTIPSCIPGIFFLSGGMNEDEAHRVLTLICKGKTYHPWYLSFSYGRALQQSALRSWGGSYSNSEEIPINAQECLLRLATMNSNAVSNQRSTR